MRFVFIPKADYKIGQIITVHGEKMRVISYTHTGKNVTVAPVKGGRSVLCICTNNPPIEAVI